MSQKRTNQKTKPEEHGTRELLEGLRRDLFSLLLEAEGLIPFTAEKREIKQALSSTATKPRTKPRRIDANQLA